jgi:GPI mannosyltransferase 3
MRLWRTADEETREAGLLLAAAVGVGLVLRLYLALTDDGIYWPDEVYQSLEPAHRWVFGYGMVAWEFREGARTWALPAMVAPVMALTRLLGFTTPQSYLLATKALFAVLGAATGLGTFALARGQGAKPLSAAVSGALFSLVAPAIYFAPRAMSENVSALLVAFGLALALPKDASRRAVAWGASLLGLSVLFRLQNGVFCAGLLGVFAYRRQWRRLAEAGAVLGGFAGVMGVLDWATWGQPFHSAWVYFRFNILEGKASLWGESPATYYGRVLFSSMPLVATVTAVLALFSVRKAPALGLLAVAFIGLHMFIPHKEYRFLLPDFPLLFALAGVGLDEVASRIPRLPKGVLAYPVLAMAVLSAAGYRRLTFGELGQYEDLKPGNSAYDDFGPVNRLLEVAHRQPDLCGLKLEAVHIAWTGGYSYLHRNVPLYPHFGPGRERGFYNYVLAGRGAGGQEIAHEGPFALLKLSDQCLPDPAFTDALP